MLKFYYSPLSVNARRVWVALLEKQIPFEPILLELNGDQFQAEFTAINPLQRIPVVVDAGLRVVESLAILDYLEAKYPSLPLMPKTAEAIALVRMVEMVAVNELQPATIPLMKPLVGLEVEATQLEESRQRVHIVLQFYEELLSNNSLFSGEQLTLADIVAGTLVPSLSLFGISTATYPQLQAWSARLLQRPSWQKTTPAPELIEAALPHIKKILERRG